MSKWHLLFCFEICLSYGKNKNKVVFGFGRILTLSSYFTLRRDLLPYLFFFFFFFKYILYAILDFAQDSSGIVPILTLRRSEILKLISEDKALNKSAYL